MLSFLNIKILTEPNLVLLGTLLALTEALYSLSRVRQATQEALLIASVPRKQSLYSLLLVSRFDLGVLMTGQPFKVSLFFSCGGAFYRLTRTGVRCIA